MLGSASKELLFQSSESLAGRIADIELSGLNVLEIGDERGNIQNLWLRGGFPRAIWPKTITSPWSGLKTLFALILNAMFRNRDLTFRLENYGDCGQCSLNLQGETVNVNKLATNLEVNRAAIGRYIDILTGLLLVRRVEPWHANVKKRLVKSPRYYVRDSGVFAPAARHIRHRRAAVQSRPRQELGGNSLLKIFNRYCRVSRKPIFTAHPQGRKLTS